MEQLFLINPVIKQKPIVIYGAGNTGLDCFVELLNRNVKVDAFCDSNSSKWGMKLMNKRVMPPNELYADVNRYNVIIASQFFEEISGDLENHGYNAASLYIYKDYWRVDI